MRTEEQKRKHRIYVRKWWRSRRAESRERCRRWYAANRKKLSEYERLRKFGLTLEMFDSKLKAQGGVCAICKKNSEGIFHVDHNHLCCPGKSSCGKCVRGLLCAQCNFGLGNFKDNIETLEMALSYLKEWK